MKKLLPVIVLLGALGSLHASPQSAASIKSTPIYVHGEVLPLVTDAPHGLNMLCRIEGGIRKRYLQVFVGFHNTSTTADLDFNPSGIALVARGFGTLMPLDAFDVRSMAKEAAHHQFLDSVTAAVRTDFSKAGTKTNNADPQFNDRLRTDSMSDSAFAEPDSDFESVQKTSLRHTTIVPGMRLSGYVYFDMGKEGAASDSYDGYTLNVPVGGHTYAMEFTPPDTPQPSSVSPTTKAGSVSTNTPTQALTSDVQITSDPDMVDIEIDGKFVGDTPLQIQLAPGDHILRFTRDGLIPAEHKFHASGGSATIHAQMKSVPMVHRVH